MIRVKVPATIANFGPGYDVFGAAITALHDIVEIELSDIPEVIVEGYKVPQEPLKNVAYVAARALLQQYGMDDEIRMRIRKGIRPGSGLGSSGASSLGGAFAAAKLLGTEEGEKIIKAALEGERVASGTRHGDNVVPAYYGGFTIVNSTEPLDVVRMDMKLSLVVILPLLEINTGEARKQVPREIPVEHASRNIALASSLIVALISGDLAAAGRYLEDYIAFPYRRPLYPWFQDAKNAALDADAYNLMISGSGPAMFAIGENLCDVGRAVVEQLKSRGIDAEYYVTEIGGGAECI